MTKHRKMTCMWVTLTLLHLEGGTYIVLMQEAPKNQVIVNIHLSFINTLEKDLVVI